LRLGRRELDDRGLQDGDGPAVPVVLREQLDEPGEPGERRQDGVVSALEQRAPRRIDGLGVLEVLLEEGADVAGVQIGLLPRGTHSCLCTSGSAVLLAPAAAKPA
jgi:hypothetical protein